MRIVTSFVTLEIRGPRQARSEINRENLNRPPFFTAAVSSGEVSVRGGGQSGWDISDEDFQAPSFFEDTQYKVRLKSLVPGTLPKAIHRDPLLFQSLDAYEDEDALTGPFSFGRQVGLCTFAVQVGREILNITLEVFPTKLDYENDYDRLLLDISSASRALALEYMRATYRSSSHTDVSDGSQLDWLILLRNEAIRLEAAVRYVDAHPQRSLSRGMSFRRIEKVRANDTRARKSIMSQSGIGAWTEIPGVGLSRRAIRGIEPLETLDTPEHRWLRFSIQAIGQQLAVIEQKTSSDIEDLVRRHKGVPLRLAAERDEISQIAQSFWELLDLPVFTGVTSPPPAGFSSLQMHTAAGYGDAYRSIMVLRQGLEVTSPGDNRHSVSDLHELYEAWCYIEVVRSVLSITGGECELSELLQTNNSALSVRLRKGIRSTVTFDHDHGKLDISYNATFRGLTGSQKPDIVLTFRRDTWPDLIVVLDAKYRVDATPEMLDRFDMPAPPADAINALHRYRDAITLLSATGDRTRPVVKGAALYPLGFGDSSEYEKSRLAEALSSLGIGAIPFLPNNKGYVEGWLRSLLLMKPEELSQPGPPFSGTEHLHKQAIRSSRGFRNQ
ncbi:DUF2357 domain-containing protein [Crystallibacter degradans]|uniref:DUF2357 domain-containing protein n=1 Tax=Crystallibacter degradans TaxID=2726743 RepID=UPI00197C2D82